MATRRSTKRAPRYRPNTATADAPAATFPFITVGSSIAFIVIAITVTYWGSLSVPFHFDDAVAIVNNETIRQLWSIETLRPKSSGGPVAGRPVVNLSFAINYALGGLNVVGYHIANIGIHVLCALLLFQIIRLTLRAPGIEPWWRERATTIALGGTLIWALHPVHTGAITYLSARSELLMALFYLLTLLASIRAFESAHRGRWAALAVASCALGMACKETMVTAPVMVVLYDRAFLFETFRKAVVSRWRFYGALAATWVVLIALNWSGPRTQSAGLATGISPWTYLLNQAPMVLEYFRIVLWPADLVFAYGEPRPLVLADVMLPVALVTAVEAISLWAWLVKPRVGFLAVWFFVVLAPTSSIVPIATEVGSERRLYLPLAGVVMLLVVGCCALWKRAQANAPRVPYRYAAGALAALTVGVAVVLAVVTQQRNAEYESVEGIWRSSLERWPSAVGHRNLATALLLAGKQEEALTHLQQTVAEHPEARALIGHQLFELGRLDEATRELEQYLQIDRADTNSARDARILLGRAAIARGQLPQAAAQFREILRTRPADDLAQLLLADTLFALRDYEGALPLYGRYLEQRPKNVGALTNVGIALLSVGRAHEATDALRNVVALDPRNAAARLNLAIALETSGDLAEALVQSKEAITLQPDHAGAREVYARLQEEASKRSHR